MRAASVVTSYRLLRVSAAAPSPRLGTRAPLPPAAAGSAKVLRQRSGPSRRGVAERAVMAGSARGSGHGAGRYLRSSAAWRESLAERERQRAGEARTRRRRDYLESMTSWIWSMSFCTSSAVVQRPCPIVVLECTSCAPQHAIAQAELGAPAEPRTDSAVGRRNHEPFHRGSPRSYRWCPGRPWTRSPGPRRTLRRAASPARRSTCGPQPSRGSAPR